MNNVKTLPDDLSGGAWWPSWPTEYYTRVKRDLIEYIIGFLYTNKDVITFLLSKYKHQSKKQRLMYTRRR